MITVLYFMTTGWACPACKGLRSHVSGACTDMGAKLELIDISKPELDTNGYLTKFQGICGLPTVIVLHEGEEVGRLDPSQITRQTVIHLIRAGKDD